MVNNISQSEYRGSIPTFDFSSGIGYSIYKKDESRWDATEKHVVAQMKRFYPSFFATSADVKQTFYDLAQMDEIQSKYLDKIFTSNKEAVIKSKLDNYFQGVERMLINEIDLAIKDVKSHIKTLENGKGEDLAKKKKEVEKLSYELNRGINDCTGEIETTLARGVGDIKNDLALSALSIVKLSRVHSCIRKSTFWGSDKKFTCEIEIVDAQRSLSNSKSALEKELKKVDTAWKKIVDEAAGILSVKLKDIIQKAEEKDTEGVNVTDQLMEIIHNVVYTFKANQVFSYKDLMKKGEDSLGEILQQVEDVPSYLSYKCEEHKAKEDIRKKSQSILNEAQNKFNAWKYNVEDEISNKLEEVRKKLNQELTQNRAKMIGEIKNRFDEFINQFESELKDVKANMVRYKEILKNLEILRNMI